MSHFHTQRLEEVSPWSRDENFRVRHFAERMRQLLQEQLEREQATEELERRQWYRTITHGATATQWAWRA